MKPIYIVVFILTVVAIFVIAYLMNKRSTNGICPIGYHYDQSIPFIPTDKIVGARCVPNAEFDPTKFGYNPNLRIGV